ncbi:hypothetical protein [Trujillonella endophytica]|uniref:Uncharacterized protein n=1 Tax=Trujillonella endophytica TaxID=673521 RepID=A0A1H8PE38_9ACTN|nr:hypothetical protein [Trujillella endophytica]SEO40061.1 hypothetical protein SAMN05660991_00121 [Trujillella endophytica]
MKAFGDTAAAELLHGQLAPQPYAAGGAGVYCYRRAGPRSRR